MMASMAAGGPGDPHTQMNTYRSYVTMLADPGAKDEIKLKAAQELSENFEVRMYKGNLDNVKKTPSLFNTMSVQYST